MLDPDTQSPDWSKTRYVRNWASWSGRIVSWLLLLVPSVTGSGKGTRTGSCESFWCQSKAALWPISIDYPEDGSIFPPGSRRPRFLWRDGVAASWHIDITFADGAPAMHIVSEGERMHLGAIDPECVSETNEPPKLTPQQAASWTWTPDAATWATDSIALHRHRRQR